MTNQDNQARERLAQQRQHSDHSQDTLRERSEEELHQPSAPTVDEKARQAMAHQRQHSEHSQEALRERSDEELH
ncbi:hypothetical protein [Leptolyngbya sp. KIOST-1]|uniref:hypothetical protein n=1 Tax=Leptolyngbya sp. KIOST-1 TaxID=1229172 RepID=UPI000567CD14|nr:hypothetical protein [Leptolyngbya sp. KIOST-1]